MNLHEYLSIEGGRKVTVAIPFPDNEAVLETVQTACENGWAKFLFIGNRPEIKRAADSRSIDPELYACIQADCEAEACRLTAELLASGQAQLAMKGQVHTGEIIRALYSREAGLLEQGRLVSHLALCDLPAWHKMLFMSDCAINIRPGFDQKLQIIGNAVAMAQRLGIGQPKVALIAPVETVSTSIESTMDADRLKREYPNLSGALIDGPFGLDVALSAEAARIKNIESSVAGDPDILLFPDLTSGNVAYKLLTLFGGATIAGILTGLKVPVVVTSRSDSARTKLLSLKLGIVLAGKG